MEQRTGRQSNGFVLVAPMIGALTGETVEEVARKFEEARDVGFFGASDLGSQFIVRDRMTNERVALVSYNGRITWEAQK